MELLKGEEEEEEEEASAQLDLEGVEASQAVMVQEEGVEALASQVVMIQEEEGEASLVIQEGRQVEVVS